MRGRGGCAYASLTASGIPSGWLGSDGAKKYLLVCACSLVRFLCSAVKSNGLPLSCPPPRVSIGGEGSAETSQKETSTCDICQFGAECDEDAEDVW